MNQDSRLSCAIAAVLGVHSLLSEVIYAWGSNFRSTNTQAMAKWPLSIQRIRTPRSLRKVHSNHLGKINQRIRPTMQRWASKKDAWGVEIYGENLTDTRVQLYVDGLDFVRLVTVNRPRTLGIRMSYKF
jgi:hypothetical protein